MRRALIIHNPRSGWRNVQHDLVQARAYLIGRGWSVELEQTHAAGDAGRLALEAAEAGLDTALVAGGDGTLNEAVNALIGRRIAIGLLPCGTANVWARQLRMPRSYGGLLGAARVMDEAHVHAIDVGRVTARAGDGAPVTRHFLLWSGLGVDAYVTRSVEPRPPSFRRWGVISYSLAALRAALSFRGMRAEIEIDGRRLDERTLLMVVSNTELYAGFLHLAPGARIDDGWLDVSVFRGQGFAALLGHFVRILLGRHVHHPRLATMRGRRMRVSTTEACDVHVDAEPIGVTPAEFEIVPRAVHVLVPVGAPRTLFELVPGETE
jgi:diacylglycerol kinase (ATP)